MDESKEKDLYAHIGSLVVENNRLSIENNKLVEAVNKLQASLVELDTKYAQLKQLYGQHQINIMDTKEDTPNETPVVEG